MSFIRARTARCTQDLDFEAPFEMTVTSSGTVSGLVVSFDTGFFARSDPPPPPPTLPPSPPPTSTASTTSAFTSLEQHPTSATAVDGGGDGGSGSSGGHGVKAEQKQAGGGSGDGGSGGGGREGAGGERPKASWFSTGPESGPTHWKQTLLWLRPSDKPEALERGDAIAGRLALHRDEVNPRELGLTVTWTATRQGTGRTFGGTQKYSVT